MKKKVALVDYCAFDRGLLYSRLFVEGYEVKIARYIHELENPEDIDILLAHPGTKHWNEVEKFVKKHPKTKVAIMVDDFTEGGRHGEIPIFSYAPEFIDDVIKFIKDDES